jgi:hypothetical protein
MACLYPQIKRRLRTEAFEVQDRLKNIQEFRPYRKEAKTIYCYKDELVNAV